MNPKKKNLTLFKVGMFAELLLQNLDEFTITSEIGKNIHTKTNELILLLEPMVAEIYNNSIYSKYAIMQEALNKTDTIAKKIYEDCLKEIEKV